MCNQILSTIHYNYKGREYEVSAETGALIAAYPSGDAGKQAAAEAALLHDDPHAHAAAFYLVHDLFRRRHDLHGRIWKAARLVASGQVYATHPLRQNMHTVAHVEGDGRFYPVREFTDTNPPGYTCDCHDYINYTAPVVSAQSLCKHIIALKMHRIIERPLPPFTQSPAKLYPRMEETDKKFHVVGAYMGQQYVSYYEPVHRPAVADEVVRMDGGLWRVSGNGRKFGYYNVTLEVTQPPPRLAFRQSYLAMLPDIPQPGNPADNHELTAALKSMTAAAKKNYPSKATMTDLDAAEMNTLLFG